MKVKNSTTKKVTVTYEVVLIQNTVTATLSPGEEKEIQPSVQVVSETITEA